jgi:transcriptional regulator with GAF, ATPase, and Fis domain
MKQELADQIHSLGKESLVDILHYLSRAVHELTGNFGIRFYMEVMREGSLVCLYTPEGELERKAASIPIQRRDNNIVKAYLESKTLPNALLEPGSDDLHKEWHSTRKLTRSALIPLAASGVTIGVLCVDASEGEGDVLAASVLGEVRDLLTSVASVVNRAHQFHQQIMLSRHLDRTRKRDAARIILAGALEMDLALDMTSVLIPAESPVPEVLKEERGGYMEVLAAASRTASDLQIYETLERISLLEGKSLLSRLVRQLGDRPVLVSETVDTLFFEDILAEDFERWDVFDQLSLRTLLMIPVTDGAGTVTCLVNYFTKRPHRYTSLELALLKNHAEALGEGIAGVSEEHLEIRVLSEIEQLLAEDTELPVFLNKVVSKAVELVGADSGSIGLVREIDEQLWVIVDGSDERDLTGAKSRGWRKARIPYLKVGGEELPMDERSMTGYVAHTGKPYMCSDTRSEAAKGGFYRNLSEDVRSELAVPIMISDAVIGVINLDSHQERYFNVEHQRILLLISRLIAHRIADLIKISKLTRKVARLRKEVAYRDPAVSSYLLGNIIGKSVAARKLVERLDKLAVPLTNWLVNWDRESEREVELGLPTLLITGETGAGKEFVFNNLYSLLNEQYREAGGRRGELPVRKTNIAAYTGELTYTELFGHRKGAYTGAHSDRAGILEEAAGGVVFLDEIGDADLKTQVQLLRFLDSGEFFRLGDNRVFRSRVVFVAATNRDLTREIRKGHFREDLYHRLSEITLKIPSLRQRREDIPDLARHFLGRLHSSFSRGGEPPQLTEGAAEILQGLDYPGNIRQLVSILQGALFESSEGVVGKEEIVRSLAHTADVIEEKPGDVALLYGNLRRGEGDFWTLVHGPFTNHEFTRSDVVELYRMALAEGGGVREAAQLLRAIPGSGRDESKALTRFRNFMYKTIGVSRAKETSNK